MLIIFRSAIKVIAYTDTKIHPKSYNVLVGWRKNIVPFIGRLRFSPICYNIKFVKPTKTQALEKGFLMLYQRATESELESLWNRNIAENGNDKRWIDWKKEFIENNRSGKAATFLILHNDVAIGEGTLLLSPACSAIAGRKVLCDGEKIANINALRIQKRYEGQGHISKLMQEMEQFAIRNHLSRLTIGVEAKETRTLAIYLHLGFTKFLFAEMEDGELVLYFSKQISPINSRK